MNSLQRRAGVASMCFLVACGSARAKCPLIYVDLEGVVRGAVSGDDQVVVELSPDPNASAHPIAFEEGYFKAKIAFDTTRSGGRFHHNCSRRPASVTVILLSNAEELDRTRLAIEDDFIRGEEGDYSLSSPLELHKDRAPPD